MVREDYVDFSSRIEEYSLEVRETKRRLWKNLTSDIPNVSEEATKDLDENGLIVRIGARIEPGDIHDW